MVRRKGATPLRHRHSTESTNIPSEASEGGNDGLYLKTAMRHKRERWVLLKIPRGDIDGVGEVK